MKKFWNVFWLIFDGLMIVANYVLGFWLIYADDWIGLASITLAGVILWSKAYIKSKQKKWDEKHNG